MKLSLKPSFFIIFMFASFATAASYDIDPATFLAQLRTLRIHETSENIVNYVTQRLPDGRTILHRHPTRPWTVEEFDEICQTLEDANGDVLAFLTSVNNEGCTLLYSDYCHDNLSLIQAIITRVQQRGGCTSALQFITAQDKCAVLHYTALFCQSHNIQQILIDAVAQCSDDEHRDANVKNFITTKNTHGQTAFHLACYRNKLAEVRTLLQNFEYFGGDVIALLCEKNDFGYTPVSDAYVGDACFNRKPIISYLLNTARRIGGTAAVKRIVQAAEPKLSEWMVKHPQKHKRNALLRRLEENSCPYSLRSRTA